MRKEEVKVTRGSGQVLAALVNQRAIEPKAWRSMLPELATHCEICGEEGAGEQGRSETICLSSMRRQLAVLTRKVGSYLGGGTLRALRNVYATAQWLEERRP